MNKKLLILYHYLRAVYCMRFSKERLKKWQKKHQKQIYLFAKRHSPFYEKQLGTLINKKMMMEHFSQFNTKQIDREKAFKVALSAEKSRHFNEDLQGITVGLSSGTSGNRGLFLVSEQERLAWCGNILAKVLPKKPWKRQKIALFLRANSTLYQTIDSKTLSFVYFDLLEDLTVLKQKLKTFQPDVLVAPPSMLLMLIGVCQPKRIISIAETLLSSDKKRLENGFQQDIFQIYQATEGFLGFTCSHGTLHLNEDLLIIEKEYIEGKRFIPIITDLFRKTQPMIRYRLDDILVEQKTLCSCGCPYQAIERIEGRSDDLLYVETTHHQVKPLFPDFISRKIIMASEQIEEYEVVQSSLKQWTIFVDERFQIQVYKELQDLFAQISCIPPHITFVNKPFPKIPGAKKRRIRREYETL